MLAVDDLLEDTHWINVQDPIRQMFLAISKAIRVQAAGIRDLDAKCSNYVTHDFAQRMIKESADQSCSKQDATQIIYQIESKAPSKDVHLLDATVQQLSHQVQKLQDHIASQNTIIHDLSSRLQYVTDDVAQLKQSPNYQPLFEYVDRQVLHITSDLDRKLQAKVERHEMETVLPHRVEEIYQSLYQKHMDLSLEMKGLVKKEEFLSTVQQKAEKTEVKDIQNELVSRMTRAEAHSFVHNQLKPLYITCAAVERNFTTQEQLAKALTLEVQDKLQVMTKQYADIQNSGVMQLTNKMSNYWSHFSEQVRSQVLDIVAEKRLGEVTQLGLDSILSGHTEKVLRQVGVLSEALRLEVLTSTREELGLWKHPLEKTVQLQGEGLQETKEQGNKMRKAMKELSHNLCKALAKKLDVKDFHRHLSQPVDNHPHSATTTSSNNVRSSDRLHLRNSRTLQSTIPEEKDEAVAEFDALMDNLKHSQLHSTTSDSSSSYIRHHPSHHNNSHNNNKLSQSVFYSSSAEEEEGEEVEQQRSPIRSNRIRSSPAVTPARHHIGTRSPAHSQRRTTTTSSSHQQQQQQLVIERLADQLSQTKDELRILQQDLVQLKDTQYHTIRRSAANLPPAQPLSPTRGSAGGSLLLHQDLNTLDWRLALGELGMNLRRELADKASREEVYCVLRQENDALVGRMLTMEKKSESLAQLQAVTQIENDLTALKHKVSGELTGARFLWTSGQVLPEGFVPWDIQVINAAPSVIQWKKSTSKVSIRVPGLYRLCVSIFTLDTAILQLYLNDEPLLSYQPESVVDHGNTNNTSNNNASNHPNVSLTTGAAKNERYYLKRLRHSCGEVTSLTIDEHVSLPPDATLSVRFFSPAPAQGFFSIRKL